MDPTAAPSRTGLDPSDGFDPPGCGPVERLDWLRSLIETGQAIAGDGRDQRRIFALITTRLTEVVAADRALVVLCDGSRLGVAAWAGDDVPHGVRYRPDGSVVGAAMTAGRTLVFSELPAGAPDAAGPAQPRLGLEHYDEHPERALFVAAPEMSRLLVVPLLGAPRGVGTGRTYGALVAARTAVEPGFGTDEQAVAESFADQVVTVLELAAAATGREDVAVLRDRERIARDLHDHVIQRLFATGLALQSALTAAGPGEPARGTDRLRGQVLHSLEDIDDTIRQIRSSIFELTDRSPGHDAGAAIATASTSLEPALGFAPSLELRGAVDRLAGSELLADVLAVVREGLTNVARHAGASRAQVVVAVGPELVTVEVTDDGGRELSTGHGWGLDNLDTRAHHHHGSMAFGAYDGGTRLSWSASWPATRS